MDFFARIILKYRNDPIVKILSPEKTNEPELKVDSGRIIIAKRDDNRKGGKDFPWGRSDDRRDCIKIPVEGGLISMNKCKLKKDKGLQEKYGVVKRYRYCLKTESDTDIVVIHITGAKVKSVNSCDTSNVKNADASAMISWSNHQEKGRSIQRRTTLNITRQMYLLNYKKPLPTRIISIQV